MTTFPLAPVVTFLRKHRALNVLDGAPWLVRYPTGDGLLCPFSLTSVYTTPSASAMEERSPNKAMLYLGTFEVCPAAEGWASRVLALALDEQATHIDFSSLSVAELMRRDRLLARWIWHDYPPRMITFREVPLVGPPPPTPAERLRAVLLHELERA